MHYDKKVSYGRETLTLDRGVFLNDSNAPNLNGIMFIQ
jgi:hypothetical protein